MDPDDLSNSTRAQLTAVGFAQNSRANPAAATFLVG